MQVYSQLGDDSPDVDVSSLKAMYNTTQRLIADDKISAGHDISDGGIAVTLLEAAFAGNCGVQVIPTLKDKCNMLCSAAIMPWQWDEHCSERLHAAALKLLTAWCLMSFKHLH